MTRLSRAERELLARTAIRILKNWRVGDEDGRRILDCVDEATFADWQSGIFGTISVSSINRCAIVLGIHTRLRLMFRDPARGYAWMSHANDTFAGVTPIELIASGDFNALFRLRGYLAAQAQPW